MYKSHKYESFIGFAESLLNVAEDDKLLIRYSAPMVVSQPGNMVITDYDIQVVEQLAVHRELSISRDAKQDNERMEESNRKSSNATIFVFAIMIISTILLMVSMSKL
jgi:Ca2+/H+ antiporter